MNGLEHRADDAASSAISTAVVQMLADRTGNGPPRAKAATGESGVVVVHADKLTRGRDRSAIAGSRP